MNAKSLKYILLICLLIAGCTPAVVPTLPPLPRGEPVKEPDPYTSVPTAVTTVNLPCYTENNEYTLTISPFVIVKILEKNSIGNWGKVRVNDVVVCWLDLSLLKFDNNILASVPTVNVPTPLVPLPTEIPIPTPLPPNVAETPPPALLIRWKIASYDCMNGKATGALIGLDVSGGIPSYRYSPALPIYYPVDNIYEKSYLITVFSGTASGDPNGTIEVKIPSAQDKAVFKCEQPGNIKATEPPPTDPPPTEDPDDPPPTEDPVDPGTPPPTEPPVCYNPQGHIIPCKKK